MRTLLTINAGTSNVRTRLYALDSVLSLLAEEHLNRAGIFPFDAFSTLIDRLETQNGDWEIVAAVHRVMHGGQDFIEPVGITEEVRQKLASLSPLAPLHQPCNLAAIDALNSLKPGLCQIAAFDTAFHARQDHLYKNFALPEYLRRQGIRRYGFHGLSYEWIARILKDEYPSLSGGRVVVAHLGDGAGACAMQNGHSVDTSMGMTALDGLPMGTRCGCLDPGAVLYMIRTLGMSPDDVENILYNNSGLKGLSGHTGDIEKLLSSIDPHAAFALDYFTFKAAQFIAAMAVSLGGIDGLVFTGGIGENSCDVRRSILERLRFLGNFEMLIIPADENRMMAIHARDWIDKNGKF